MDPIKILIVEDNPGDFALVRRMFDSMKAGRFVLVHAGSLAEANMALDGSVDLIFLDLNLPDSRDLDTLRQLRAKDSVVPILIHTALEDRQKAVEALALGAQDYFVKGKMDSHLLERTIWRHLQPSELRESAHD
jgi:DNA-binding response OmpR family regulator